MDLCKAVAVNTRRLRKEAGISQEALGLRAGLNRTYIGSIERQEGNATIKSLQKIADALQIEQSDLFLSHKSVDKAFDHAVSENRLQEEPTVYLLCESTSDEIVFYPLDVHSEDLTLKVLSSLIERGYEGEALIVQYRKLENAMLRFTENNVPPASKPKNQ